MPTRNVVLTDRQAEFVKRLVSSGRYQNVSEVLREGVRLIERRESEDAIRLRALRRAIDVGIADIEAGRFFEFDSSETLHRHLAALADETLASRPAETNGER